MVRMVRGACVYFSICMLVYLYIFFDLFNYINNLYIYSLPDHMSFVETHISYDWGACTIAPFTIMILLDFLWCNGAKFAPL